MKKVREIFFMYRALFFCVFTVYLILNINEATSTSSLFLFFGNLYLLLSLCYNYYLERNIFLLLIENKPRPIIKTEGIKLNIFIACTLIFDVLVGLILLINAYKQTMDSQFVFIYSIFIYTLSALHSFYFPTYSKNNDWRSKNQGQLIFKGGAAGSLGAVLFVLIILYYLPLLIVHQANPSVLSIIFQYKLFFGISLISVVFFAQYLRLHIASERIHAREDLTKVFEVTNFFNNEIEKIESFTTEKDMADTEKMNDLAKKIGESMNVEYFSIGRVIKKEDARLFLKDIGIYIKPDNKHVVTGDQLNIIKELLLENSFVGDVIQSETGCKNLNGKPESLFEKNYDIYENELLPSKKHSHVLVVGLYEKAMDSSKRGEPIGYLHAINRFNIDGALNISGFSSDDLDILKSYGKHLELVFSLKSLKQEVHKDEAFIEKLISLQEQNEIVLKTFDYFNDEFDCHLTSLWMPVQEGFISADDEKDLKILLRTVKLNDKKFKESKEDLEKQLMDKNSYSLNNDKNYISHVTLEKFKREIEAKLNAGKNEDFEVEIVHDGDHDENFLNCWKEHQEDIKAESLFTIPIYHSSHSTKRNGANTNEKLWWEYLLGVICLRMTKEQYEVLSKEEHQKRLKTIIKYFRVILENAIFKTRFDDLEILKNKLLDIQLDVKEEYNFYQGLVEGIAAAMDCKECSLLRANDVNTHLVVKATTAEDCTVNDIPYKTSEIIDKPVYNLDREDSITVKVYNEQKLYLSSEMSRDKQHASGTFIELPKEPIDYRSFISMPIINKNNGIKNSLGVIRCTYKINEGFLPTFSRLDEELLSLIVGIVTRYFVLIDYNRAFLKFIPILTHEIAQPLQVCMSYTGLISRKLNLISNNEAVKAYFLQNPNNNLIINGRDLMTQLNELEHIRMILSDFNIYTFDNADTLKREFHKISVTIKKVKELLAIDAYSQYKIDIQVNIRQMEELEMYVDVNKFKQVLYNLIKNAIRYSYEGQTVSIYYNRILEDNKEWDTLEIENNGIGISEKDKDKIFEFGFRSQKALNYSPTGTGIGLYVVKKIIEDHEGYIKIIKTGEKTGIATLIRLYFPVKIKNESKNTK